MFDHIKTFEESGFEVIIDYCYSEVDPIEGLDSEEAQDILDLLDSGDLLNLDYRVRVGVVNGDFSLSTVYLGGCLVSTLIDDEIFDEMITDGIKQANEKAKDLLIQLQALDLK